MDFLSMRASWQMIGICVERRILTSQKNKTWQGWICKVETFGGTYSLNLTEEQYKVVGEGMLYKCTGGFEDRDGKLHLITRTLDEIDQKAGKAS